MKKINLWKIVLPLLLFGASLFGEPIGLRVPDSTATVGDFIDIPVYADSSLTGENIYSYRLQFQFYASRMQGVSAYSAGTLTESFGDPTINTSVPGLVTLAGAGSSPLTGTGILFYIRFEMLSSGGTYINFNGTENNYFNEGSPEIIFDNGYISISNPVVAAINISPDSKTMLVGDSLQFTVSGDGTAPYQWSVSDENVASISDNGLLKALDRGFTLVGISDSVGLADTTTGYIEVLNLTLSLPDTSAWQGDTIDIPITYRELSDIDIYSGQFYLSHYSDRITAIEVIQTGTLLESFPEVAINTTLNRTDFAFAGTTPISGNGTLMIVRFAVSPENTGGTYINFNDVIFNEDIPAGLDNGYFSILSPPSLGITPSSSSPLTAGDTLRFSGTGGIPPYSYTTSNSIIATIDSTGLFTALHSGTVYVTVADSFGTSRSTSNIQIYDTWITIPDTTGPIGLTFLLPVFIDDLPSGQLVNAIEATFSYKSPELEFIEIVTAGTFSEGWTFSHTTLDNIIQLAGAGAAGFSAGGTVLMLKFQITDEYYIGENGWVKFDNLLLNEGVPLARTQNGGITGRQALPDIDLSQDSVRQMLELGESDTQSLIIYNTGIDLLLFNLAFVSGDTLTISPTWLDINCTSEEILPGDSLIIDLSFNAGDLTAGTYTVSLQIISNDPDEAEILIPFTLVIESVNDPPVISSSNNANAVEDEYFVYHATATDPEGMPITFTFTDLSAWLSADADSVFGIPTEGILEGSFQALAYDGVLFDTLDVSITVTPVNDPPEITSPDSVSAIEDILFTYTATAIDPEDSTLSFSFEDLPAWLIADADSVNGIPLEGTLDTTFRVIVSDGELTDTMDVIVTIKAVNDPPLIVCMPDTNMLEDDSLTLMLTAEDIDSENLTFTAFSDTSAVIVEISNDSLLTLMPVLNWFGATNIHVIVDDGEFRDSTEFSLDVCPVNDPPSAFSLIAPADSTINNSDTVMVFQWEIAIDADRDSLSYGIFLRGENFEYVTDCDTSYINLNILDIAVPRDVCISWSVFATDTTDTTWSNEVWHFTVGDQVGIEATLSRPYAYALNQNFPNPFNPTTTLRFAVPEVTNVRLVIYDIMGREILTLVDGMYAPGWYNVHWSGKTNSGKLVSTGIYLALFHAGDFTRVIKMAYVK
ncbi:MAG: Ig-like domain-containing protein [Candidatus Marinimicrobia bacterium]|nr:Ig-like domain-containing protein [Candidatus Neomarinimicrobiota bacterium]